MTDKTRKDVFDEEIAPALTAVANRCNELKMSACLSVEYQTNTVSSLFVGQPDAGLAMRMMVIAAKTGTNVDGLFLSLLRHFKESEVDTSASIVVTALNQIMELGHG